VVVLTPSSPLYQKLLGKTRGHVIEGSARSIVTIL
jgi:hypothetical protein